MNKFKGVKVKGHMGEYVLKNQMGEGGFAVIYTTDNDGVICKVQNVSTPESAANYRKEKNVLVTVKHQNIVKLMDWT